MGGWCGDTGLDTASSQATSSSTLQPLNMQLHQTRRPGTTYRGSVTLHTLHCYLHLVLLQYYTLILSQELGNFKGLGTVILCNRYPYRINSLLKRYHISKITKKCMNNYKIIIKRTSLLILGTTRFNIYYLWKCHICFTEETDYVATNVICCLSVNVEARSEEVKTFC